MKIAVQYVSDSAGRKKSVQVPLSEWEKLMTKLKKYEQTLKLKTDLREAFQEVSHLKKSKSKKVALKEFLNEL